MKKFILGFLSGILAVILYIEGVNILFMDSPEGSIGEKIYHNYLTLSHNPLGINIVLTKRCTADMRNEVQQRREYFQCNKIQIYFSDLLFDEITEEI